MQKYSKKTDELDRNMSGVSTWTNVTLDDWLTVHCSITLVDLQLDAQNSYLFTYNTFINPYPANVENMVSS